MPPHTLVLGLFALVVTLMAVPDSSPRLPVVDLQSKDTSSLLHACTSSGFFYLANHGINHTFVRRLRAASDAFFELPRERKEAIAMVHGGPAWRGWFPMDGEMTSGRADHKEGLYLSRHEPNRAGQRFLGANLYPECLPGDSEALCELPRLLEEYMAATEKVGMALVGQLGRALNHSLDGYFGNEPTLLMRVFRYAPDVWGAQENEFGVQEHTDYGGVTLLLQDDTGGLQVKHKQHGWIDAPPLHGGDGPLLVINLGDMLERLTHGLLRSTLHRVRNRSPHKHRYSFPVFVDPCLACTIVPLPRESLDIPAGHNAKYERWDAADVLSLPEDMQYGQYLYSKVVKVFPALASAVV